MHITIITPRRLPAMLLTSALAAVTLSVGCAGPLRQTESAAPSASAERIVAGEEIATANCASCHSVGKSGPSPLANAPAFRTIAAHYRLDVLREELQQGVHVGAADMPKFAFSIAEIDALGAYLTAIQIPEERGTASIK